MGELDKFWTIVNFHQVVFFFKNHQSRQLETILGLSLKML